MALFLPQRWKRPPIGPIRIDETRLGKDILFAFVGGREALLRHFTTYLPSTRSTLQQATPIGIASGYDSSHYSIFAPPTTDPGGALSIGALIYPTAFADYSAIIDYSDSSITNGFELRLGANSATDSDACAILKNSGYSIRVATGSGIVGNSLNNIIFVSDGNLADSGGWFINGVTVSSTLLNGTGIRTGAGASANVFIGSRSDTFTKFTGGIQLVVVWSRVLREDERKEFYYAPWTLFEPQIAKTYFLGINASTTSYTLTANTGSFTESGQSVVLKRGYTVLPSVGSFTESGQSVNLKYNRNLVSGTGTYTLSGQTTNLLYGRVVSAAKGTFTLNGQEVNLVYNPIGGYTMTAQTGSFALTGKSVNLLYGRNLQSNTGTFTLSGQNTGLLYGRNVSVDTGSYTFTGKNINLLYNRVITVDKGTFNLSGKNVTLSYSGAGLGNTVNFYRGLSRLPEEGVSSEAHIVVDVGGGNYTVTPTNSISGDKLDAISYEGYEVLPS